MRWKSSGGEAVGLEADTTRMQIEKLPCRIWRDRKDANPPPRCRDLQLVDDLAPRGIDHLDGLHAIRDKEQTPIVRRMGRDGVTRHRAVAKSELPNELLLLLVEQSQSIGPNPHDENTRLRRRSKSGKKQQKR